MDIKHLWTTILINPILNLLVIFYKFFEWLHIPGPLGWAIILLTVSIRLLLYPLMQSQLKSAKKMAELKPHLDALNLKHKDNKQALQQAQLELYKQHGVNPAAGCLPLLVQMPVLIALYNVFYQVLQNANLSKLVGQINSILYLPMFKLTQLDVSFLGVNLGIKPSEWTKYGWWLFAVPIITALLQFWQTKLMTPALTGTTVTPPAPKPQEKALEKVEKKEAKPEDTAAEMQKQMMIITPLMFGWFAYQFPLGLALYWNIFGLFGILQQMRVNRTK